MKDSVLGVLWGTEMVIGATEKGSIIGEEVASASIHERPERLLEGHGSQLQL